MCNEGRPVETSYGIRVFRGQHLDAYVGRHAAQRGYLFAVWRGRHVSDLTELSGEELLGYWSEVGIVGAAVQRHFQPRKVNYEVFGNQVPHLHTHITARFAEGDLAPGAPLPHIRDRELPPAELTNDVAVLRALLGNP
jgi:diadenosine tetraphosphate (Ap4A) HIT family hydrolase